MLKSGFTNLLLIVVIVLLIGTNINMNNIASLQKEEEKEKQPQEQRVNEEIAIENQRKLEEEILRKKIETANRFVKNVSDQVEIILLNENGEFKIHHDRTPENNQYSEWLVNAELTMNLDYRTIFSIKSKDIKFDITEDGSIIASYDTSKIVITAIEISNVVPVQKTSIFGSKYKPTEVAALEKIAKDKILEQSYNDENILKASENLKSYINDLAQKFGVEDVTIIANNEDIYIKILDDTTSNTTNSANK